MSDKPNHGVSVAMYSCSGDLCLVADQGIDVSLFDWLTNLLNLWNILVKLIPKSKMVSQENKTS